ncbi:hypothetical protein C8R43DRAFT_942632 [Mycena crocata]|nr:hypothetical protein C8R43DRAFT_942632 [Mycena crocata]
MKVINTLQVCDALMLGDLLKMQTHCEAALERRPVQERQVHVHMFKIQLDEIHHERGPIPPLLALQIFPKVMAASTSAAGLLQMCKQGGWTRHIPLAEYRGALGRHRGAGTEGRKGAQGCAQVLQWRRAICLDGIEIREVRQREDTSPWAMDCQKPMGLDDVAGIVEACGRTRSSCRLKGQNTWQRLNLDYSYATDEAENWKMVSQSRSIWPGATNGRQDYAWSHASVFDARGVDCGGRKNWVAEHPPFADHIRCGYYTNPTAPYSCNALLPGHLSASIIEAVRGDRKWQREASSDACQLEARTCRARPGVCCQLTEARKFTSSHCNKKPRTGKLWPVGFLKCDGRTRVLAEKEKELRDGIRDLGDVYGPVCSMPVKKVRTMAWDVEDDLELRDPLSTKWCSASGTSRHAEAARTTVWGDLDDVVRAIQSKDGQRCGGVAPHDLDVAVRPSKIWSLTLAYIPPTIIVQS